MIFENFMYKENEQLITVIYFMKKNNISIYMLSNLLGIPYTTLYKAFKKNFNQNDDMLNKISTELKIERISDFNLLDIKSDNYLLNYLYNKRVEELDQRNNISFIQYNINKLIKSRFKDLSSVNELECVKEFLNNNHLAFINFAKNKIISNSTNKYVYILLSYESIKNKYYESDDINFLACINDVVNNLERNLMYDRALELKFYELIVKYRLNILNIKDLIPFELGNLYINEIIILKAMINLDKSNFKSVFELILKIHTADRNLFIDYLNKNSIYSINNSNKIINKDSKSRIYDIIVKKLCL